MAAHPPARNSRAVQALAQVLFRHVGGESVRVIEAVAAALANGRTCGGPMAEEWSLRLAEAMGSTRNPALPVFRPGGRCARRFAMCHRIARRALGSSLPDPTNGATAFHAADAWPSWSAGRLPVSEIGPLLFYRV